MFWLNKFKVLAKSFNIPEKHFYYSYCLSVENKIKKSKVSTENKNDHIENIQI